VIGALPYFEVQVTEFVSPIIGQRDVTTEADRAFAAPMAAPPRSDDVYATPDFAAAGSAVHAQTSSHGRYLSQGVPASSESMTEAPSTAMETPELALTISVSDTVFLELYGAYDANGRFVEYRLRYVRTGTEGQIKSDVMLSPLQVIV